MFEFSLPGGDDSGVVDCGAKLPKFMAVCKARRGGLLGELLILDLGPDADTGLLEADFADLRDSFTFGRKGVARGDWPCTDCGAAFCDGWAKYCDCARR